MAYFRLTMLGENFLVKLNRKPELVGFYQTVHIEASSPKEAETVALDLVRNSDLKDIAVQAESLSAMIYTEKIEELESFEGVDTEIHGRTYFRMEESKPKWWQFWRNRGA